MNGVEHQEQNLAWKKPKFVPIGTREYRARMVETRKVNQEERAPLDTRIKIAKDKEVIRLLGA